MNDRFLKIQDTPDYVKDQENNAILNTNLQALAEYKQKKKQTALIFSMEQEINMLKEEIMKIKNHLNLS
jgi:hypothetical protein